MGSSGGNVIRDVVIKARMDLKAPVIPKPDTTAYDAAIADTIAKTTKKLESILSPTSGNGLSDAFERDRKSSIGLRTDVQELTGTLQTLVDDGFKKATDSAGEAAETVGGLADEYNHTELAALAAGEGMRDSVEGAVMLSRGVALVVGSNGKMEDLVRTVAKVQGSWDLLRGSYRATEGAVRTVDALVSVQRTHTAVTIASAQAQAIHTGSVTLLSRAYTALKIAMGPVGLAMAGVTVAIGALVAVVHHLSKREDDAIERANAMTEAFVRQRQAVDDLARAKRGITSGEASSRASAQFATGFDDLAVETLGDAIQAESDKIKALPEAYRKSRRQLTLDRDNAVHAAGGRGEARIFQQLQSVERIANMSGLAGLATLLGVDSERQGAIKKADADHNKAFDGSSIAEQKELVTAQETRKRLTEQLHAEERKRLATAQRILETGQREIQTIQQAMEAEKKRFQATRTRIGLLDDGQLAELRRIAEKKATNQPLTREEILRAQQFGASNAVSGDATRLANQRTAGLEGFLGIGADGLNDRERDLQARERALRERLAKVNEQVGGVTGQDPAFADFQTSVNLQGDISAAITKLRAVLKDHLQGQLNTVTGIISDVSSAKRDADTAAASAKMRDHGDTG